MKVQITN